MHPDFHQMGIDEQAAGARGAGSERVRTPPGGRAAAGGARGGRAAALLGARRRGARADRGSGGPAGGSRTTRRGRGRRRDRRLAPARGRRARSPIRSAQRRTCCRCSSCARSSSRRSGAAGALWGSGAQSAAGAAPRGISRGGTGRTWPRPRLPIPPASATPRRENTAVAARTYAVLLRGINVGGKNKLSMPALRMLLEDAGYDGVATYIQSGNVVLRSSLDRERTDARPSRSRSRRSSRSRFVWSCAPTAELERIAGANPFLAGESTGAARRLPGSALPNPRDRDARPGSLARGRVQRLRQARSISGTRTARAGRS